MATLNNLSTVGTELTTNQLDEIDGGLVPLLVYGAIVGLAALDVYIWSKVFE